MKATPHLFFSFTKLFLGPLRRRFTKENIKKFTLIRFWFADHHWKFNMVPDEHDGGDAGPDDQDDLLESDNDEEPVAGPSHSGGQSVVLNISCKSMFCSKKIISIYLQERQVILTLYYQFSWRYDIGSV